MNERLRTVAELEQDDLFHVFELKWSPEYTFRGVLLRVLKDTVYKGNMPSYVYRLRVSELKPEWKFAGRRFFDLGPLPPNTTLFIIERYIPPADRRPSIPRRETHDEKYRRAMRERGRTLPDDHHRIWSTETPQK